MARPGCTHSLCDQPAAVERVTPGGQLRYSPWCCGHRERELRTMAYQRREAAKRRTTSPATT